MNPVLYDFQREGVRFLVRTCRALLADDMGLGKTVQAIAACEERKSPAVLVLCPNTLKANWAAEIGVWAPGRPVSVLRGPFKKKARAIEYFNGGYMVANIECIRRPHGGLPDVADALVGVGWDTLIVDEAHNIKNRNSQQTRGVMRLAAVTRNVYLLTGTPIMNRVDELWPPLHALRPRRWPYFWSFVREHAKAYLGPFGWVIDGRPTQPERLRSEIAPVFLRRDKAAVFPDMPPKIYQKIWLELEGEQLRIYRDIEKEAMARVSDDTIVITPGILAQLTRCKQVAVSAGLIGGRPEGVKIDALMDIVRGTGRKMLVFSQFAGAVKLVAERLAAEGISHVVLIGETGEAERGANIARFRDGPGIRVFLATTAVGGCGINLTAASLVVFLDKHWTPAMNEQAVDRTRPHLQTESVQIVELLCRDTVDEMIEDVLAGKCSIIEAVIGRRRAAHGDAPGGTA